ncbi:MAG TPA: phosphoserine phosphatase SerB [Kiloniellales bacterium]|nr:phosphoserine phosphatase SerB [Kiloniellales bacterium]
MQSVLTIVGDPTTRLVSGQVVSAARKALAEAKAETGAVEWLAPSLACDLFFNHGKPATVEQSVRAALKDQPFDIAAQPTADRRKKLLVADMDSTIVTAETLDELADHCGLKEEIAPITLRTMKGELPFEESLRLRVAKLEGLSIEVMVEVVQALDLAPGARSLVRTMRAHGAYAALVSGGFTFATEPIAELCGFHEQRANVLLHMDGRLTGEVQEPILGMQAKLDFLRELCARLDLHQREACAVGDGANDLAMLDHAGLGVAFHGKPKVREEARFRVDHGDLTALLYFQGYKEAEFS